MLNGNDKWTQYAEKPAAAADKWAQYAEPAAAPAVQPEPAPPAAASQDDYNARAKQLNQAIGNFLSNVVQGFGEGALQTVGTVSKGLHMLPLVGETLAPQQGIQALSQIATPENLTQRIGAGLEQVGETIAAGPARAGTATTLAKSLPFLGRWAVPAARVGTEALTAAGSAALHGQPVGTSAALGAAGATVSEGARAVAPALAESAIGIPQRMRGRGRTIGKALLEETSGFRPKTIAAQATQRLVQLNTELEQAAVAASQRGPIATTKPALDILDDELDKAFEKNAAPLVNKLNLIRDQLTIDLRTQNAIGPQVTPQKILALKRGIGDLVNNWSSEERRGVQKILPRVYGALDKELDRTVPGAQQLNQRMTSLIPVKQRAKVVSNAASLAQRLAGRVVAHTGALTGAATGAAFGYREAGTPGAIAGGTAGLVVPEVLGSPTSQLAGARMAASEKSIWPLLRALIMQKQQENSGPPVP